MKLTRVTITGADDAVDPEALLELSAEHPYVEWGILRGGIDRHGTPRYPLPFWVARLNDLVLESATPAAWALHLCGDPARHAMAGSPGIFAALKSMTAQRVQLNGFSKYRLPLLTLAQLLPDVEFILQCQSDAALVHAAELSKLHSNVSALWDISGGRGFLDFDMLTQWPVPQGLRVGRAGGITPDNVVEILEALRPLDDSLWVDLETGARTDDRFDLDKVRRILELAKPFISEAA